MSLAALLAMQQSSDPMFAMAGSEVPAPAPLTQRPAWLPPQPGDTDYNDMAGSFLDPATGMSSPTVPQQGAPDLTMGGMFSGPDANPFPGMSATQPNTFGPEIASQFVPGGDPFGGVGAETGDKNPDEDEAFHKMVTDAYDAIMSANGKHIAAINALKTIKRKPTKPFQVSPLQMILATLGSGIAGSISRSGDVAANSFNGFINTAQGVHHNREEADERAFQDQLREGTLNVQAAGQEASNATNLLGKAQTQEYHHSQLEQRRVQGVVGIIDRLTSKFDKVTPENADDYFGRLNKLYTSAGMPYMRMSTQEIEATKEAIRARQAAKDDEKVRLKNEGYFRTLVSGALQNPSSGRAVQTLRIAKGFLAADDPRNFELDKMIGEMAPSFAENKLLSDKERVAVNAQLKIVRAQLTSLDKDLRGTANPDPAKVKRYTELLGTESELTRQLYPQQGQQQGAPGQGQSFNDVSGVSPQQLAMAAKACPKNTDCSAFTQSIMGKFGVDVGRSAVNQWDKTKDHGVLPPGASDFSQLHPGDLLFFDTGVNHTKDRARAGGFVTHVGIYMGNGKFIQDGGRGNSVPGKTDTDRGVRDIASYAAKYKFMGATRPLAGVEGGADVFGSASSADVPTASDKVKDKAKTADGWDKVHTELVAKKGRVEVLQAKYDAMQPPNTKFAPTLAAYEGRKEKLREELAEEQAHVKVLIGRAEKIRPGSILGAVDKQEQQNKDADAKAHHNTIARSMIGTMFGWKVDPTANPPGWVKAQGAMAKDAIAQIRKDFKGKEAQQRIDSVKNTYKNQTGLDYVGK